ncbi:MAG TPA: PHP domain-containing protein [Gemmatimonadaceae bacterium]|jgi:putative hydrolase
MTVSPATVVGARLAHLGLRRFSELDADACSVDLHMHTTRTDGEHSIQSLVDAAREQGLRAIAFTEHVRRDSAWFADFANDVRAAAAASSDVRVLVGCEAKALATEGDVLDASPEIVGACDIVLGSVHRFPDGQGGLLNFADLDAPTMAHIEFELALGLVKHATIDVLAHPGGMYQRRHGAFPEDLMREIMQTAVARGVAVEISTSYLPELEPFLELCREIDPYVSIGSDVHRLDQLGVCCTRVRAALGFA